MNRVMVLLLVASLSGHPAAASPLGDRVVAFCRTHLGQRIGNGQCAGLATQALEAAGARRRGRPDAPNPGDYVWGRQIFMEEASPGGPVVSGSVDDIQPGDVIQFRDTKFMTAHFGHHTAVVREVDAARNDLLTYQQNAGHRQFVTEGLVHLGALSHGWLRIYRPVR